MSNVYTGFPFPSPQTQIQYGPTVHRNVSICSVEILIDPAQQTRMRRSLSDNEFLTVSFDPPIAYGPSHRQGAGRCGAVAERTEQPGHRQRARNLARHGQTPFQPGTPEAPAWLDRIAHMHPPQPQ